jgi:hypothetical protein
MGGVFAFACTNDQTGLIEIGTTPKRELYAFFLFDETHEKIAVEEQNGMPLFLTHHF